MATPAASELHIHLDAEAEAYVILVYDGDASGITITGEAKDGGAHGQMLSNVLGIASLAITSDGGRAANKPISDVREGDASMGGPRRPRPRPRTLSQATPEGGTTSMAGGGKARLSLYIGPENPRETITSDSPKLKLLVRVSSPTTVRVQRT